MGVKMNYIIVGENTPQNMQSQYRQHISQFQSDSDRIAEKYGISMGDWQVWDIDG